MAYTPIIGTLAYLWDRKDDTVLMIHRNARSDDEHLGKYNGLGGKLEDDEDVISGVRRELYEEAGLQLTSVLLRGTISWPGFGPKGEDWLGFIFLVDAWSGVAPRSNAEGDLSWVARPRLIDACSPDDDVRRAAGLPMWEGDRHFVPLVFDDNPRAFHGVMPYHGGYPNSWTYERL